MIDNKAKAKQSKAPAFQTRLYDASLGKPTAPPQPTATPQRFPIPRSESPAQRAKAAYTAPQPTAPSMPASKPGMPAGAPQASGPGAPLGTGIMAKMGAPSAGATPAAAEQTAKARAMDAFAGTARGQAGLQAFAGAKPPMASAAPVRESYDYVPLPGQKENLAKAFGKALGSSADNAREAYLKSLDMEGRLNEQLALGDYGVPDDVLMDMIQSQQSGLDQDAAMAKAKQLAYMNQMGIGTSGMAMHGLGGIDAQTAQAKSEMASKMWMDNHSLAIQQKIAELGIAADLAKQGNQLELAESIQQQQLDLQKQAQLMDQVTKGPEWVGAMLETWGVSKADMAAYLADVEAAGDDQVKALELLGNFKLGADGKMYYGEPAEGQPEAPAEHAGWHEYSTGNLTDDMRSDQVGLHAMSQNIISLMATGQAKDVWSALKLMGYDPAELTQQGWHQLMSADPSGNPILTNHGYDWDRVN